MMADVYSLSLRVDGDQAAAASIRSILRLAEVFPEIGPILEDLIDTPFKLGKFHQLPATVAGEIFLCFEPNDRLHELVATIRAFDGNIGIVEIVHGWPVLSLGGLEDPSVAEAGRATSLPGEGAAATGQSEELSGTPQVSPGSSDSPGATEAGAGVAPLAPVDGASAGDGL